MGRWEQVKEEGVTLPLAAYGFVSGGDGRLLHLGELPTSQRPNFLDCLTAPYNPPKI